MQFVKGQSGNPGGRPKRDRIITQKLVSRLTENNHELLNEFVEMLLTKALIGDAKSMSEVLDRVEGKAPNAEEDRDSTVTVNHYHYAARQHLRRRLLPELAASGETEAPDSTDGRAIH